MDTAFVKKALKYRYENSSQIAREWILMFEVGVTTGGAERYIDAVAFNCWKSKEFKKIAFEIKVSRADFLNEVRDPTKRIPAMTFFDEFYFVAPVGIIPYDEVPRGCGLMEVGDQGVITIKKRIQKYFHEAAPFTNGLLMSLVRNAYNQGFKDGSERVQMSGPDELYKMIKKDFQYMETAIASEQPVAYSKEIHRLAQKMAKTIKDKGLLEDHEELFPGL